MKANSYQKYYGITTFGESHGAAVGVVIEDVKPGIKFPKGKIEQLLAERRPGKKFFSSARNEADKIHILSGIFEGKTTGMPICLIVYNEDFNNADYENLRNVFRPGHADLSFFQKFKIYDHRGGGRASGRETIARVAASGLVEEILQNVIIMIYPEQIGKMRLKKFQPEFQNELFWFDKKTYPELVQYLSKIQKEGDSVGGKVKVKISNLPAGLGDPVFEKLDADLAKALVSIGAVKGIEFGSGFSLAKMIGSEANDQISEKGFLSNHNGGILGGISNGNVIEFSFVVKPTSSISKKQKTIDNTGKEREITISGRHDVCIIPRLIPVAKAMIKLVLADAYAHQKLIVGEHKNLTELREALDKIDEDILIALKRRMEISTLIGKWKKKNKIQVSDKIREKELIATLEQKASNWNLSKELVNKIWKLILNESKEQQ